MTTDELIQATAAFVQGRLEGLEGGHDWWHTWRVWQTARRLQALEGGDPAVIELAALLHDVADSKFQGGDESAGPRETEAWLRSQGAEPALVEAVTAIVAHLSFRGQFKSAPERPAAARTLEFALVQDADRLDALGAIGVARTFSYGGYTGAALFDPRILPRNQLSPEAYKSGRGPSLNHFHEKLLKVRDHLNTASARRWAESRHRFLETFLEEFALEWEGRDAPGEGPRGQ